MHVAKAIETVGKEYDLACEKFPEMRSYHEGFAILKEEVDELWDEVKAHPPRCEELIKKECVQVAAMALRFLVDLC